MCLSALDLVPTGCLLWAASLRGASQMMRSAHLSLRTLQTEDQTQIQLGNRAFLMKYSCCKSESFDYKSNINERIIVFLIQLREHF